MNSHESERSLDSAEVELELPMPPLRVESVDGSAVLARVNRLRMPVEVGGVE
jgi:hypothetical protein